VLYQCPRQKAGAFLFCQQRLISHGLGRDHHASGLPPDTRSLSRSANVQISIDPFKTDDFASASLSVSPPPADPPSEPAAIMLVQQIPEANESLNAGDHSWVSLYREPDSLQSITLLGTFTLSSGSPNSMHNGFEIFRFDPPEPVPAALPLFGAAMACGYSRHLRRRLRLGLRLRRLDGIAPVERRRRASNLAADPR
jgi:hypothetical protein